MKTKLTITGLAITTLLISGNCFALGWSVEAKSDVRSNTQEAGADANRDSYNRAANADNIGGNQANGYNRTGETNITGNNATIVKGDIRVGHDYSINTDPKSGSFTGGENRSSTSKGGAYSRATSTRGAVTGSTDISQKGFTTGGVRNNQSMKNTTVILGNVSNQ